MDEPSDTTDKIHCYLARMQAGDDQARERLLEHAARRLQAISRSMLQSWPRVHRWEETDDVFVEAVSRLNQSLKSAHPTSVQDFFNLAALQIRRVLIDLGRRYYGPRGLGTNQSPEPSSPPGSPPDPCDDRASEPANLMEWTEFHQHVESLPAEEKEVFNLLWYAGLSQEEACQTLNISERTLRRRWFRARMMLNRACHGEPLPE